MQQLAKSRGKSLTRRCTLIAKSVTSFAKNAKELPLSSTGELSVRHKGEVVFTLEHQDGNIEYKIEKGGFAVVDSKLYLSIESKALEEDAFPDCYYFAIDGLLVKNVLESSNIVIATNPNDETPNVYVYTSFHACDVKATVGLTVISEDKIEVALNVISEDVNYYNEKAKHNPFKGSVTLTKKTLGEMWLPS